MNPAAGFRYTSALPNNDTTNPMPYHDWITFKEIVFYLVAIAIGLFVMGYSVHMLVGGIVSATTEKLIIAAVCAIALVAIGFMAADVKKRRQRGL